VRPEGEFEPSIARRETVCYGFWAEPRQARRLSTGVGPGERHCESAAAALKASHRGPATPAQSHPKQIGAESTKSRGGVHTD
jgi:hypothetical protein